MNSKERYAAWKAAGLCLTCGKAREDGGGGGEGAPRNRCGRCLALNRERMRQRREARRAAGLPPPDDARRRKAARLAARVCLRCGGSLAYVPNPFVVKPPRAYAGWCVPCSEKQRGHIRAFRQRERDAREGGVNVPPRMVGSNARRLEGGYPWRVLLCTHTLAAYKRLRERYYNDCRLRGETPRTHQTSRIARETIMGFVRTGSPTPIPLARQLLCQFPMSVRLDAPSRAVLKRHADAAFGGNLSACFRAMLMHAAMPQAVVGKRPAYSKWDL
jgi:hypothetical protein